MELQRGLQGVQGGDEVWAGAMEGSQGWFTLLQGRREMLLGHTGVSLGHGHSPAVQRNSQQNPSPT